MVEDDQQIQALVREALTRFAVDYLGGQAPTKYVVDGTTLSKAGLVQTKPLPDDSLIWEMPVAADQILMRVSAVRMIGLAGHPGKTAKVILTESLWEYMWGKDTSSLLPGVAGARIAAGLGASIRINAPSAYDQHGRWLVEDFIEGRKLERGEVADFLSDALLPFYRRTVRRRSLRRVSIAPKLIDELDRMEIDFPLPSLDGELPVVLGHGDISFNNVLRPTEGGYALIDWDRAAVLPAAFDLAELCSKLELSLAREIVAALADLDSSSGVIPPASQLALGVLDKTASFREEGNRMVSHLRSSQNMTRNQARRHIREQNTKIREFLLALRELHPSRDG